MTNTRTLEMVQTNTDNDPIQIIMVSFAASLGIAGTVATRLAGQTHISSLQPTELTVRMLDLAAHYGIVPNSCLYLSTPITTGRSHLQTANNIAAEGAITPENQANAANRRRAQIVAQRIRSHLTDRVIDPTLLVDISDWEQSDYHYLWTTTIRIYAKCVVLVNDWQYSVGCANELRTAVSCGLPLFDERMNQMSYTSALQLLEDAINEIANTHDSGPLLKSQLDATYDLLDRKS